MSGGEWTTTGSGLNVLSSELKKSPSINDLMGLYGLTQSMTGKATPQAPQMIPQVPTLQPPQSMMEILKRYGR